MTDGGAGASSFAAAVFAAAAGSLTTAVTLGVGILLVANPVIDASPR